MNFSVTERGTFKRCKRQAVYASKNAMHLTPLQSPLNLSLGSLMHRGFQWWLEHPETTFETHIMNAAVELQNQMIERYKKVVGVSPSKDEMLTTYEAIEIAIAMAANYELRWGSPLPKDYRLIKPEQKVIIPIPNTEHECEWCVGTGWEAKGSVVQGQCSKCDGEGVALHYLEGRLDGLIQHIPTGRLDILEHKTYGARPKTESLQMNDQFIAYIWLVTQLGYNEGHEGMIAYDGLWRRKAVPRGRTFEDLFLRLTIPRRKEELEEFGRFLAMEVKDMAALYSEAHKNDGYPNAYKTVPWNGCWDCKFVQLCNAQSRNEMKRRDELIKQSYTQRTDDVETEEDDSGDE